jgi:undecaprenyl-diphosphatase
MSEWLKTIVLGVVEGLTEFLPVSSTGHLLVASNLLRFEGSAGGTFEIFIQFGAVVALLVFYSRDVLAQARALRHDPMTRRFWLSVVVAFLPAAVLGLLLRNVIKSVLFGSPGVIAWSLILGGIVLIVVERLPRRSPSEPARPNVIAITPRQALIIGFAQSVALVPGVSRSGAAIVGGLLLGLDRATATTFAFYLAIPTLGAATLFDLASSFRRLTAGDLQFILVGTVVAGVVAGLSIKWLLSYVAHNTFVPFGIYRIIAGAVVLILMVTGILQT